MQFVCTAVKRIRMCESCNDWVVCFQVVKYKLSHTSYQYTTQASNSSVDQQDTIT